MQAIAHGVAPNDHFDQGLAAALHEKWPTMVKDFRHYAHQTHPKPGEIADVFPSPTLFKQLSETFPWQSKNTGEHHTKACAQEVAEGAAMRDRIRALSIAALSDRRLSPSDVPKLVREVLEGALKSIHKSVPASQRNVLREVFDGLSDGVKAIASAGSATIDEVCERGRAVKGKNVSVAAKRMLAADADFLGAVKKHASKASKEVRKELEALVARAERTGPKVVDSVRKTAKAADGRLLELTGETARAGVRMARRTAGALAMGAGGFLEGLAVAMTPKDGPTSKKKSDVSSVRIVGKKTAKKVAVRKTPKKQTR